MNSNNLEVYSRLAMAVAFRFMAASLFSKIKINMCIIAMMQMVRSCFYCMKYAIDVWYTDGFKHLQAHVVTSAYDSQDHVDAPKCHPNTRKAVLDKIFDWIVLTVTRVQWILWLNGAAGAGCRERESVVESAARRQ